MNTKKIILTVATMATMAIIVACGNRQQAANSKAQAFDSLTIEIDSIGVALTLHADYPSTDTLLQRCLAEWVADNMFDIEDEQGNIYKPAYQGDIRAYLQRCAQERWNQLRADIYDVEPDPEGDSPSPEELMAHVEQDGLSLTTYEMNFNKVLENDSLVGWECTYNIYANLAAHPIYGTRSMTVNKLNSQVRTNRSDD